MKIWTKKISTTSLKYKLHERFHITFSLEMSNLPQSFNNLLQQRDINSAKISKCLNFKVQHFFIAMVCRNKTYPVKSPLPQQNTNTLQSIKIYYDNNQYFLKLLQLGV